ncbi:MAG: hypothetical protein ABI402_00520 [Ferruginibacter sp.]
MKKILIKLLIIIISVIVIDRSLTYIFDKVVFSKTMSGETGGTVNYLIKKKKDKDFLILGSSRAKYHLDPSLLTNYYNGNGYNAGISGTGGLIYNDLLLRLLTSKGIKPKAIMLQVDIYPYFTTDDEKTENEFLQLYPFIGQSDSLRAFIYRNVDYTEKFKLFFHTYRYNGKFLNVIYNYAKRKSVKDNNGFVGLPAKFDTTGFRIKDDLAKKHTFSQAKINALLGIVQTCKANNIKLSIVFSPSYQNSLYLPEGNTMITTLLRNNGVQDIYDYSQLDSLPSSLQAPSMWKDALHLNKEGAAIFSTILNEAIAAHH